MSGEESQWANRRSNEPRRVASELAGLCLRHPESKFNRNTLRCALDCGRPDLEQALIRLVLEGVVDVRGHDGVAYYFLKRAEKKTSQPG